MTCTTFVLCMVVVFVFGYGVAAWRFSRCALYVFDLVRQQRHDALEASIIDLLLRSAPLRWPVVLAHFLRERSTR